MNSAIEMDLGFREETGILVDNPTCMRQIAARYAMAHKGDIPPFSADYEKGGDLLAEGYRYHQPPRHLAALYHINYSQLTLRTV
jgi:hypothetical protein